MSETMTKRKGRIPKGEGKQRLINSSRELFLKNGYEATSPQAIYKLSGVGQGSFYHYFSGKADLMKTVLDEICAEELALLDSIMEQDKSHKEILFAILDKPRQGRKGCRFGRFVYESSVINSEIANPIEQYFHRMEQCLIELIEEGQRDGSFTQSLSAAMLSQMTITQIQGGYIVSRAKKSDAPLKEAIATIKAVLAGNTVGQ